MKIIIMRHPETKANDQGIIYGRLDYAYTKKGYEQGSKLIEYVKYKEIQRIYSSPLKRANGIATEISKNRNIEVIVKDQLAEMDYGIFEGLKEEEIINKYEDEYNQFMKNYNTYTIPNGECYKGFCQRVKAFIVDELKAQEGTIVIVTHGGVIRLLMSYLLDIDLNLIWHFEVLPGGVVEIDYSNNYGKLQKLITL